MLHYAHTDTFVGIRESCFGVLKLGMKIPNLSLTKCTVPSPRSDRFRTAVNIFGDSVGSAIVEQFSRLEPIESSAEDNTPQKSESSVRKQLDKRRKSIEGGIRKVARDEPAIGERVVKDLPTPTSPVVMSTPRRLIRLPAVESPSPASLASPESCVTAASVLTPSSPESPAPGKRQSPVSKTGRKTPKTPLKTTPQGRD